MRPYTALAGFEEVVLEESYVLTIEATPGVVTFRMDLSLTPRHSAYVKPSPLDAGCFKLGRIRFIDVHELAWRGQGLAPARDASGELDYGHIDSFSWDGQRFELAGDWGTMVLSASRPILEVSDQSPP